VQGKATEHQKRCWAAFWQRLAAQARQQADQQQAGEQGARSDNMK
jgi:hypothetical protein